MRSPSKPCCKACASAFAAKRLDPRFFAAFPLAGGKPFVVTEEPREFAEKGQPAGKEYWEEKQ